MLKGWRRGYDADTVVWCCLRWNIHIVEVYNMEQARRKHMHPHIRLSLISRILLKYTDDDNTTNKHVTRRIHNEHHRETDIYGVVTSTRKRNKNWSLMWPTWGIRRISPIRSHPACVPLRGLHSGALVTLLAGARAVSDLICQWSSLTTTADVSHNHPTFSAFKLPC